jgi:hypothetical protein
MIPALRGRFRCVAPDYIFLQEEKGPEIARGILAFVPD